MGSAPANEDAAEIACGEPSRERELRTVDRLAPPVALLFLAGVVVLAVRIRAGGPGPRSGPGDRAARRPAPTAAEPPRSSARGRAGRGLRREATTADAEPARDVGAGAGEASPGGGPDVRVQRRRYAVSGSTARQLRRSLRRNGRRMEGRVAFAWTDWSVRVGYEYERVGDACRIVEPDVDVRVAVILPDWRGRDGAPTDLVRRWERDLATMRRHEAGHVEVARRAGRRVHRALEELEAAPCASLQSRADSAADEVLREARRAQDRYDERTRHGEEQPAPGSGP